MISHENYIQRLQKRVSMLQWTLGRFDFALDELEMRPAKVRIENGNFKLSEVPYFKMIQWQTELAKTYSSCPIGLQSKESKQ